MEKFNLLGICAGQGALLFPFLRSKKFNLLGNIEPRSVFHTKSESQWKANFKGIPFLKGYELPEDWHPDIILSSPDCGSCSVMRLSKSKTLGDPKSNKSIQLVFQSIQYYEPALFLIENLPRLLSLISKEMLMDFFKNYKLIFHERSVSDFGNSQVSRKRLVIIGVHLDKGKEYLDSFNEVFQVNTPKLTRDLLVQAPQEALIPFSDKVLAMYDYRKLPEKKNLTVRQVRQLWTHDFKDEKKWPIKTAKMSTLPGVYRLENDKPPLTLRPADRQFRPDGYPLGIEDFKAIMGFPDKFEIYLHKNGDTFEGDFKDYHYWLNKARYTIAKGSVYEVGIWFKKCLKKIDSSK
nr:MAG: C-5 cytosine-specific DNA methylase [Bacteriophage sp.]